MSTIHVKSSFPERLADIIKDINTKLSLDLVVQVVPGASNRGLVEISNDRRTHGVR